MSKRAIQPYWRPDFKIQETLPDIKVVRTDFMINFVAVALALAAIFTLLQREYRAHVLRSSISVMEERVLDSEAADRQSLKESERFRKSAQSVIELQRFFRVPFVAHELLAELAGLKPQDLIFTKVSFSDSVDKPKGKGAHMSYAIRIVGDVQELPVLAQFKEAVEASSFFNPEGFALDVDESIQRRDAQTGVTPFRVSISLSPETTPKKGGKK